MPQFQDLARPILIAISRASGETYRHIDGNELMAELARMGHEPNPIGVRNLMEQLRDDNYVQFQAAFSNDPGGLSLIRLGPRGREEVAGWPKSSGVSAADIEALIDAFEAHADDPDVPEPERTKARAIAGYVRDLSLGGAAPILTAWLRSIGIAP